MYSSMTHHQYLQLMGIDVWLDRDRALTDTAALQDRHVEIGEPANGDTESNDWRVLREQVTSCKKCNLHLGRKQTVFGAGNTSADWMVIGEAPGAEEDRQGEPIVGRAGKLLNAMLMTIGLSRSQVFIANILKCRPPNNRDPQAEEVSSCENYLEQQITLLQPKIILCVGHIAAQNLLKADTPIEKLRGQTYQYPGSNIPIVVTYHPAYLLRSPMEKRQAWDDLQLAQQIYQNS